MCRWRYMSFTCSWWCDYSSSLVVWLAGYKECCVGSNVKVQAMGICCMSSVIFFLLPVMSLQLQCFCRAHSSALIPDDVFVPFHRSTPDGSENQRLGLLRATKPARFKVSAAQMCAEQTLAVQLETDSCDGFNISSTHLNLNLLLMFICHLSSRISAVHLSV